MQSPSMREPSARVTGIRPALRSLVVVAGLVAVAVLGKLLVQQVTGSNAGFVVYIPAVVVAAWYRGFLAGGLATVLGALFDTFLFLPTVFVFVGDLSDLQLRLLAYLAAGVLISYAVNRLRSERDRARAVAAERHIALEDAATAPEELNRVVATERRANELRDAFNSIVSHELRTPITSIYGGAKLLAARDRDMDEATRHELVADLEAEADRLYRLVEDLLILARSERGPIERATDPVLLSRLVTRVVESEQARWPESRFAVQASTTLSTARGDETYVEQVLRNLLSNAAKYTPHGRRLMSPSMRPRRASG